MVYFFTEVDKFDEGFIGEAIKFMPMDRVRKLEGLKKNEDKYLTAGVYILLLYGLKQEGIKLKSLKFKYNNCGKPYFEEAPSVNFNLSHSDSGIACAISDSAVGVDIQKIVQVNKLVMQKAYSETEIMNVMISENHDIEYTKLWTKKESYIKAKGKSISKGMHRINFYDISKDMSYRVGYFLTSCCEGDYIITVCQSNKENVGFEKVSIREIEDFIKQGPSC